MFSTLREDQYERFTDNLVTRGDKTAEKIVH